MTRLKIGEILVAQGAITDVQLNQALQQQRARRIKVGEALIAAGAIDEATLFRGLAKQAGLPFVDLDKGKIAPALVQRESMYL